MSSRTASNSPSSANAGRNYGGQSRKRRMSAVGSAESESKSSRSKLSQSFDALRSPHPMPKPSATAEDHQSSLQGSKDPESIKARRIRSMYSVQSGSSRISTRPTNLSRNNSTTTRSDKVKENTDNMSDRAVCAPSKSITTAPIPSTSETPPRRRRLIDALAAQKIRAATDHISRDETDTGAALGDGEGVLDAHHMPPTESSRLRTPDRRGATPTNRKVRFTYSQTRRIVGESQTSDGFESPSRSIENDVEPMLAEMPAVQSQGNDPFALDESDDDGSSQPAIKSVHELRRAGANNRFADEMDDLISRIGLPGISSLTMRRNALCELVQKLQRKDFLSQFRDHAARDAIAREIGDETDTVCGFVLVTALLSFLTSDIGPAPNLLRQLANDGIGKLLAVLLRDDDDIGLVASQKKMNLSRISRSLLDETRTILLSLPIWHGYQPATLSSRTAALQLMALFSRSADAVLLDRILIDCQQDLISVATWACEEGSYDHVDYALTIFTLETQSSAGVTSRLNRDGSHPARVAKLLLRALQRWPSGQAELDLAILKLSINTTNHECEAVAFDDPRLSTSLARRVGHLFAKVGAAVAAEKLEGNIYNELLLMLGVMINIMEYCSAARRTVDQDATTHLVALWQDRRQAVTEADSEDKSKMSVAVGYLSVLLGYMCLAGQARDQLEHCAGRMGLETLRVSIQQFAVVYKAVETKAHGLDELVRELRQVG